MIWRTLVWQIILVAVESSVAISNDGFYQGSGATIVPVVNKNLRVISEKLTISPLAKTTCYELDAAMPAGELTEQKLENVTVAIGKAKACPRDREFDVLIAKWHAKAVYKVEVLQDQSEVQIGFPIPEWNHDVATTDGLVSLQVPAVVNFQTSVNGKPVTSFTLASVPTIPNASGKLQKDSKNRAYLWTLTFKKGSSYELITEYDFGIDYSIGFYEGREFPKGSVLWFDQRSQAQAKYETFPMMAEHIQYFLRPISLWGGGAPAKIEVEVRVPKNKSIYHLIPMSKGLVCISKEALHFRWENDVPTEDLDVVYPEFFTTDRSRRVKVPNLVTKQFEYDAWNEVLLKAREVKAGAKVANSIKKTCALVEELKRNLPPKSYFHGWVDSGIEQPCVKSCYD